MAYYSARVNLVSASFPMLTELWGQSIIVPQYDQNFDRQVVSAADQDRDKGIPQAFYMHNVTPTTNGYQSISYTQVIPAYLDGTSTAFDAAFTLQTASLGKYVFCPSSGLNYVYSSNQGGWYSASPIAPGTLADNVLVTTAYLHGETYIYYGNYGCFKLDTSSLLMIPVTLASLVATNILGVCPANGYMIAWTTTGISWSSLLDATDFTPSLTTGAGGGQVNDAKGPIRFCLPISGGFIVYCERNAVAAKFTGNTRYPFVFSEIAGSLGSLSPEQVTWQSNLASHWAWTTAGLQEIDKNGIKATYADISDFIAAKEFEDFDETTDTLISYPIVAPMTVKLCIIASRYLIISYGVVPGIYTHAIFYDNLLKRYGKLKITHRDCFEWNYPSLVGPLTYAQLAGQTYQSFYGGTYAALTGVVNTVPDIKSSIAFLQQDGTVKTVNFQFSETSSSGVLITGKYQFMRASTTIHLSTTLESVPDFSVFTFKLIPFMDGKTPLPAVTPIAINKGTKVATFIRKMTALSYAMLFKGAFNLNSIETTFTKGGTR